MTTYYTHKSDVPLKAGQRVRFKKGSGYYAFPPTVTTTTSSPTSTTTTTSTTTVTSGTGLGVLMYRGQLAACSHLKDGTYEVVIGSWGDPALTTAVGERYAYTAVANTGADPNAVWLDPTDPSGFLTHTASLPQGVGVFLDNTLASTPGMLAALQTVSTGLKAQGRKLCVNAGAYVEGPTNNDGTAWAAWATQLVPVADRIMLEHWQSVYLTATTSTPGNGETLRSRGGTAAQQWDAWQKVPAACHGKFVGITYAGNGGLPNAIYGRASLLLSGAPGVFIYNNGDGNDTGYTDPYDVAWVGQTPQPIVDPVAVKASL